MKYMLSLCILAVAFLINPLWGCGGDDSAFNYDRQDMVDYAVGTWSGTLKWGTGETSDFELIITEKPPRTGEQGLDLRTVEQPSCQREFSQNLSDLFVRNAHACIQQSTLPIEARLTTSDGRLTGQKLNGQVMGFWKFDTPHISIELLNGATLSARCDEEYHCVPGSFYGEQPSAGSDALISMRKN